MVRAAEGDLAWLYLTCNQVADSPQMRCQEEDLAERLVELHNPREPEAHSNKWPNRLVVREASQEAVVPALPACPAWRQSQVARQSQVPVNK